MFPGSLLVRIKAKIKKSCYDLGYTLSWVDKQIIKACLPRKEFLYGPERV